MSEALTAFFQTLAGSDTPDSALFGFLSFFITAIIVILLIDPLLE